MMSSKKKIYIVMVQIQHVLGPARQSMTTHPPSSPSLPVRESVAESDSPNVVSKVKLSKLMIQPFKGDLTS